MIRKFPNLCRPLKIGDITLKNRMVSAPMAFPDITSEGHVTKEAARSIKRHGAIANIELSHGGKYAGVDMADKAQGPQLRYGPSAETLSDGQRIQEMPQELIREIVESFGRCAALAKRAGFDMALVHVGNDEEIVRCVRCFTCLAERVHTQTRICSVNPVIGREYEGRFALPVARPKKVLVAGGGPAGMKAAVTAAERGHRVILCEKSGELGGALKFARSIPFKHDLYGLVRSLMLEMKKAGVEIRLNTEVTQALAERELPDAIVLAVGAARGCKRASRCRSRGHTGRRLCKATEGDRGPLPRLSCRAGYLIS